ncbi:alpha/beta fold hydrolase [Geodermatophilus poikilotrophus]|uniref:Pimeloyl-ACP methyl ester carboxylesterase n=1 Tax=Geodermatophilus poikilotrophus TaxID=1333667 RepID=A0A1I0BUK8_9ACTN|nr:alpha/beta hydrolase [Geodermatophilus poikilotrophus]SET10742.1 Pimeloyl-ACP methyl ester carboxylesterase [Geodermatophilus poikilotrophus]
MTRASSSGLYRMTYETVASADGTPIAYEVFGAGPLLIAVCGATCDRALMRPTAQALGRHFTTVDYDRRGRGDSGDTLPYAVDREIEDIAALIDRIGGPAHLYGHSSGAGLVLRAVAAGLPVDEFVLHDPPYSPDESSRTGARRYGRTIRSLLAQERRAAALETFCRLTGMPEEVIDGMRGTHRWAELTALAPTLAYDSAVMGDIETGGAVPEDVAVRVTRPGLVLVGGASPPFMVQVGRRLAHLLPEGRLHVIEGHGHVVPPDVLAPVVAEHLRG